MKRIFLPLVALVLVCISSPAYAASSELLDLWGRLQGIWVPNNDKTYDFYGFHSYEYVDDGRVPVFVGGWFHSEGYSADPKGIKVIGDNKYIVDYLRKYENEEGSRSSDYQVEIDVSDIDKGILRVLYLDSGDKVELGYFASSLEEATAKIESQW